MKSLRAPVSFFLAGLILIATIGVTVNQHICMGQIRSTAVFVKAASCGMPTAEIATKGNSCCTEKALLIKTKNSAATVLKKLSVFGSVHLIAVLAHHFLYVVIPHQTLAGAELTIYKPPLPERNIPIRTHSLLI